MSKHVQCVHACVVSPHMGSVSDKVIDIRWPPSLWPSTLAFVVVMVEVGVEV